MVHWASDRHIFLHSVVEMPITRTDSEATDADYVKRFLQTTQIPCDKLPTYQQAMKINEGNNFAVILVNCNTV